MPYGTGGGYGGYVPSGPGPVPILRGSTVTVTGTLPVGAAASLTSAVSVAAAAPTTPVEDPNGDPTGPSVVPARLADACKRPAGGH